MEIDVCALGGSGGQGPEEKLVNLKRKLEDTQKADVMCLREIQSLIGLLNFVCRAVTPGRSLFRRIDLPVGVKIKSTEVWKWLERC